MINWQLQMSLSGKQWHSLLYRGKYRGRGVQMEVHTPVKRREPGDPDRFGEAKRYFFIDDDPREFATEEELRAAIEEQERGRSS